MPAWSFVGRGALFVSLAVPVAAAAQTPAAPPAPVARISMADAVRLALEHNHQLRAQRLNVDISKADEITAALKPNPVFTSTNENFPVFSPSQLFNSDNFANNQNFVESLSYLFERGGKRRQAHARRAGHDGRRGQDRVRRRAAAALQTPSRPSSTSCSRSRRSISRSEDLKNFSNVVDVNQERLRAGDLAEADFCKISLQKLQFEQDVSSARSRRSSQAKAALRQSVGFEALAEDFDVDGDLAYTKHAVTLDDLKRDALATRPDLLAAQSSVKLAQDTQTLAYSNRARDVDRRASSTTAPARSTPSGSASPSTCRFTIATRATSRTARSPYARRRRAGSAGADARC